jgi:hypothetical protein
MLDSQSKYLGSSRVIYKARKTGPALGEVQHPGLMAYVEYGPAYFTTTAATVNCNDLTRSSLALRDPEFLLVSVLR